MGVPGKKIDDYTRNRIIRLKMKVGMSYRQAAYECDVCLRTAWRTIQRHKQALNSITKPISDDGYERHQH